MAKPKVEKTTFCTNDWKDGGYDPLKSFQTTLTGYLQKGLKPVTTVEAAPWVRDAYAAENIAREKRKLRPLTWTRFCYSLAEEKSRKKMLVGGKFMDAALSIMRSGTSTNSSSSVPVRGRGTSATKRSACAG